MFNKTFVNRGLQIISLQIMLKLLKASEKGPVTHIYVIHLNFNNQNCLNYSSKAKKFIF